MAGNFGQIVRRAEYAGVCVSERIHAQCAELQKHAHETLQVCLIVEGELVEEFDGIRLEGAPGTVIIRPAMAVHRDTFRTAFVRTLLVEYFRGPRFDVLFAARPAQLLCAGVMGEIGRELRATDLASLTALEGAVLQLAARMIRSSSDPHSALAARVRRKIDDVFPGRVDVGALAAELQVSRSHLFETFRRLEGKTVGEYVAARRLERARQLLAETSAPLSEVAVACGFADQSHLTRAFRVTVGETPAQFRRRTRG